MSLARFEALPAFGQGAGAEQQQIGCRQGGLDLRLGGLEAAVLLGRDAARVIGQRWWCVLGVEQQIIQIHHHGNPLTPGFGDELDHGGFWL